MLNLVFYIKEYSARWRSTVLSQDVTFALQEVDSFTSRFPAINEQVLRLYAQTLVRVQGSFEHTLRRLIVGQFLNWLATEVDPGLMDTFQAVRGCYFPPRVGELPSIELSQASLKFLEYLDEMAIKAEKPDQSNWQSVARYMALYRNRAMFGAMVWNNLNITTLLDLDRYPFDKWLLMGGGDYTLAYDYPKKIGFRPESLAVIRDYLVERDDSFRPLFISGSPSAGDQARLSREMAWHEARKIWDELGYPHYTLKQLRGK